MDMLGFLIVLVIAIPVLAIVGVVMAVGTRERLKRLEFRLTGLEARLAGIAGEAPSPLPSSGPVPESYKRPCRSRR